MNRTGVDLQSAINALVAGRDLSTETMTQAMRTIMNGHGTAAQIGGFLIGLRMKGETTDELTAAAQVMRELATPVQVEPDRLVDTCGTGGDARNTFNISTASALVAAAAGARVAKHGNRSVSSQCGSADVLEQAGIKLDLGPEQVAQCIDTLGVGFMFAPAHHGAMKHAIGPRRELGTRTLFNLLGPLTNPANAPNQVMGVFDDHWLEPMAHVLHRVGSRHVLVVHAADGLDEISINAPTRVAELKDAEVGTYSITPEEFGIARTGLDAITVDSAKASLSMMLAVLDNQPGPALDIVLLNAGAAIYVAGVTESMASGIESAREVVASGKAKEKLASLIDLTNKMRK